MADSLTQKAIYLPLVPPALDEIAAMDGALELQFRDRIRVLPFLTRQLVSFQANKNLASYRWYKYKEGFSAALVEYFLHH